MARARVVRIYKPISKWAKDERTARVVVVHEDRLTLDVPGHGLADFRRDTGAGMDQPRNGDQRTARSRQGQSWRGWRLRWADWSRWYAAVKGE